MWQIYYFYSHHAASLSSSSCGQSTSRSSRAAPYLTAESGEEGRGVGGCPVNESLLLLSEEDYLQLLSDFKLAPSDLK